VRFWLVGLFFCLIADKGMADDYSADIAISNVNIVGKGCELSADITYKLSPLAKEALNKGINLTWRVLIKIDQKGWLWNSSVYEYEMAYQIQHHAVLNLYSVEQIANGATEAYSTLNAALNSISKIRQLKLDCAFNRDPEKKYYLAVKVLFDREALAVPLRALSYFDKQWALSSPWELWQLQK